MRNILYGNLIGQIRLESPLIHCITNYVTANDVANMILAAGASPVMADHVKEVEKVTERAKALVLNMGTLKEDALESMVISGKTADKTGCPVVLDPVGIGASPYRAEGAGRLLTVFRPAVIRGNASEIKTIGGGISDGKGVDVGSNDKVMEDNLTEYLELIGKIAEKYDTTVVLTGPIDLVSDGKRSCIVRNGHPWMSRITGTGCMLDGVLGAFLAVSRMEPVLTCAAAVAAVGICGEVAFQAAKDLGTGSFRVHFIDAMSRMDDKILQEVANIEIR